MISKRQPLLQTEWKIFPYAGTGTKESFSQVIFTAAGIPEVKGELSAKVTMHQILRLVYVDQKTDYDQVFRADLFDKALTREAVGDLLCGIYDDELYTAESQLAAKHAERSALQSELKTILSLLGDQAAPSIEWLEQEKATRSNERERAYSELESLRTRTTGAVRNHRRPSRATRARACLAESAGSRCGRQDKAGTCRYRGSPTVPPCTERAAPGSSRIANGS